jgi:hypothetical protein
MHFVEQAEDPETGQDERHAPPGSTVAARPEQQVGEAAVHAEVHDFVEPTDIGTDRDVGPRGPNEDEGGPEERRPESRRPFTEGDRRSDQCHEEG